MDASKVPPDLHSNGGLIGPRWFHLGLKRLRFGSETPPRTRRFTIATVLATVIAAVVLFGAVKLGRQPHVVVVISPDQFVQSLATHQTSIVDLYFREHLNPNARAAHDRPLIVAAALTQDWETVRRLIKAGACVDLADENGSTSLMAAAEQGRIDMLRELMGIVTSVDLPDRRGQSALHRAIAARKFEAVQFLLPFMPDLGTRGSDLLAAAFDTGDMKITEELLERMPLLQEWSPGTRRILETALAADNREQVRLLLKKHAVPPTPERSNVPLLAHAVAKEDTSLLETLLACGADPNTVLPSPCDKNFLASLNSKYLRNFIEDEKNVTVLALAAGLGRTDCVRALTAAGADRNRASARYKILPLYLAAQSGYWRCTQILLGSGPSPEQLRIEISLASQKVAVIRDGIAVFNTTCSTGRSGFATRAGDYVITDKDRYHVSTIYKVEMPYFMRLSCLDFGMHEGYVPNYPASHGCIRLPGDAARKFFAEIPIGTLVSVK